MEFQNNSDKLIYIQLADWIVDEILSETFAEGSQIPSVAEISAMFKINHITALKGIGILTDAGIIYKKRGIGMFVAEGAKAMIHKERHGQFLEKFVHPFIEEAKKLGISREEILQMIENEYQKGESK